MTTLHHVKKARKTIRGKGVKKGDSYFWWAFRVNGQSSVKHVSKQRPSRSQLTQSPFLRAMFDAEDTLAEQMGRLSAGDVEEMVAAIEDAADAVREEEQSCREKLANLPDSLQEGPTGQLLAERAEACERIATDLDAAAAEIDGLEGDDGEQQVLDAAGIVAAVDWSLP